MHFAHTESEFEMVYRLRVKFSTFHEVFFYFHVIVLYKGYRHRVLTIKGCDGSYALNTAT